MTDTVTNQESAADVGSVTAEQATVADSREVAAQAIVSKYLGWGTSAGILPVPIWDVVAIGSVQIMMLKELYALYGVKFSEKKARSIVAVLLASMSPQYLAGAFASSLIKFVPGVGSALGRVSLPILAGTATYAVGKVMTSHLAKGGNLDNFDPKSNKAKFKDAVEKGKNVFKRKSATEAAEPAAEPVTV